MAQEHIWVLMPKPGWYFGRYRGSDIHERCYGWLITGYWYAGGEERRPYTHSFWGLCWAGRYTLGVGRIVHDKEPPDVDEFLLEISSLMDKLEDEKPHH